MAVLVSYTSHTNYCIITIANGKVNAISTAVITELHKALDLAEQAQQTVILTGVSGVFSAGFDLKEMTANATSAKELVTKGSKLSLRLLSFSRPIIIACSGHAIAKGAFLLLSADYRIGADGPFKIGLNEVQIGMTMHNAGIAIAKGRLSKVYVNRCVNNAELFAPQMAINAGFLDAVVTIDSLLPRAIKTAEAFAKINAKAHAQTKLKVRAKLLKNLKKAIVLDSKAAIKIDH